MTEEAFKAHIIMWGVESAAPQFGTTIATLKGWMRGDSALPAHVWNAWIQYSSAPVEERPPIHGFEARAVNAAPSDDRPGLMAQSSLASRVLADPGIAARIKAETEGARGPVGPSSPVGEPPEPEIIFDDEWPEAEAKPNGQHKTGTIAFCCPTDRDFPPVTFECFSALIRNYQMPMIIKSETLLVRARNVIAERFLRTDAEWSFWVDSDMLIPFGNAAWFKDKSKISNLRPEQLSFDAVKRLLSHKQPFVGAVYAARTEHSQMVMQPDLDPRTGNDKTLADQIRKNQAHGLKDVAWIGFGCCLVHRSVFEAVGRNDPSCRSGQGGFFDTQGAKGEDVRFSERASAAGFRPKLDCELVCGHLGRKCFIPEGTKPIQAIST